MTSEIINELLSARTYLGSLAIRSDELDRESLRHITGTIKKAMELLKSQPEIVRCKDCIDRRVCAIARKHDGFTYNKFDPDWFCADGERR